MKNINLDITDLLLLTIVIPAIIVLKNIYNLNQIYFNENYFIENVQFLLLMSCSVLSLSMFFEHNKTLLEKKWFIFFFIFFFFCALEEVNYFQSLFRMDIPNFFLKNNSQHEINLHNMHDGLLEYICLILIQIYFWLQLLLFNNKKIQRFKYLPPRIDAFKSCFVLIIIYYFIATKPDHPPVNYFEIEELIYYLICFFILLSFKIKRKLHR